MRNQRKSKKKEKGTTCCNYFSIKTGFILYGIFDIICMITFSAIIIHNLVKKKRVKNFWYVSLALTVPNALTFIYVILVDKAISRKVYTYMLAVKLGIVAFSSPLIFMIANHDWMYAKFCLGASDDDLHSLAVDPNDP